MQDFVLSGVEQTPEHEERPPFFPFLPLPHPQLSSLQHQTTPHPPHPWRYVLLDAGGGIAKCLFSPARAFVALKNALVLLLMTALKTFNLDLQIGKRENLTFCCLEGGETYCTSTLSLLRLHGKRYRVVRAA